jgi:enoyl-CoA hydratase/carnithine racemase
MADFLLQSRRERVVTLTLNRPEARNAFSHAEQFAEVAATLEAVRRDATVSAIILTGAGSAFCAGGDVKDFRNRTNFAAGSALDLRNTYRHDLQRMIAALYDIEIPTIAAVNGPAIGLGCDLASCCDIRIASDKAAFAESFIRLGLIPGDGGAWFLQRIVGISKAAEMLFTGDTIDAAEAQRIGLVSRVVTAGELMPAAEALACRIAAHPPQTLRLSKRLLREAQRAPLETVYELSAAFQALVQRSGDHQEAVDAAAEKRSPSYTGQ